MSSLNKIPDFNETLSEIRSYSNLEIGWDFNGSGKPVEDQIINMAIDISEMASYYGLGIDPSPLSEGGINLTVFDEDKFLDIYIREDCSMDIRIEKGKGKPYLILLRKEKVNISTIEFYLIVIKSKCDISFAHYPFESIKEASADLMTQKRSGTTREEYQYLIWSVPKKSPLQHVNT
jgi:hypothetical protein